MSRRSGVEGHPEADGSVIDTAVREAAEEVGVVIAPENGIDFALCRAGDLG